MAKRRKRNNRKNNRNNNKNNNKNKNKKVIKKILLGLLFVIIAVLLFIGIKYGVKLYKYDKEAKRLVKEGGEDIFKANQTSIIYDADGNVITELIGERDSYYLDYKDIPYFVKAALITSEDRNFYSHSGVDY
ncbi:MAG: transglycosylase domain-containing protein, partial [Lachnospiraceae bacterium]|nr:transglycosylase domain-containing protein [Lachnospiraceae bacterium]